MHMTCPCGHHFCWLCLGPFVNHDSYYSCNKYDPTEFQAAEDSREKSAAALKKYQFYYERFEHHDGGRKRCLDDWLEQMSLKQLAVQQALECPLEEVKFMTDTMQLIAESMNCLAWTYAFRYFNDETLPAAKLRQLEKIQGHLEHRTNDLYELADPHQETALAHLDYLCKGRYEVQSYGQRLGHSMRQLREHLESLCKYLEGGMQDPDAAFGEIRPGYWKCARCPGVQRLSKRKCELCGAWKPR
eukprot:TRINITY_DN62933_c0_g1_i2.p1 TRINITY_DN62933_c0_g1~~TRINITY_DN62933_c0_g1_i2.p1  ORF type:complete len:244 (-),score=33.73 TRINITY_DN62933_c0_g1_i2:26-757(-)